MILSIDWGAVTAITAICGTIGALVIAGVHVYRARTERRVDRTTIDGERARDVIETYHDAIMVVASDGRIILANQRARLITGFSEKEILGMSVNDLLPPEFRKRHSSHMRDYLNSPRTREMGKSGMELWLLDKRGEKKRVNISLTPREGNDNGPEVTLGIRVVETQTASAAGDTSV